MEEMEKSEARECMRLLRGSLDSTEREKLQYQAQKRLLSMPEWREAKWVYPFVSCRTEIDTLSFLRIVLAEGRHAVAVPRVVGKKMEFVAISSMQELVPGKFGILEPKAGKIVTAREGFLLMPGLAFDLEGNRVGYGAGFYDRYLEENECKGLFKAGYAFDFQVVDTIRREEHDRQVDAVVTDQRVIRLLKSSPQVKQKGSVGQPKRAN